MDTANTKIKELKNKLDSELKKNNSDNDLILSLSLQIASFDKNKVRFSVDAGLINRLGKELVGRHETAVAELVKNAYDADAISVDLFFDNSDSVGGTLIIKDNGSGMNRQQLIDGFMTISSSDKVHNPKSIRYKRTRAGQKGIGRFASQRLGSKLIVTTQTKENENALKVTIEWDKFTLDSNLLLISNQIEEVDKTREEGTTLCIKNLRDIWSVAMVKRAYRYISDLLQPFPLSERFEGSKNDPGFKASFYKESEEVASEKNVFHKNAIAEIEACVDNVGNGFYSLKSKHFDFSDDLYQIGANEKKQQYKQFNFLKDINVKAFYFIYRINLIPKQIETAIRQNADEYGGIRLYRNGFRVLPYAEKDNDWLGLDASVRKRVILTPHGNNNFYGFIEVLDKEGKIFQELSSREGLLENEAFNELKDFVYKVLVDATLKINSIRGRKTNTSQEGWEKKSKNIFENVVAKLEEEADRSENNDNNNCDFSHYSGNVVS
jgi:Histidine kinase-, DNA gyrase B-, and HSP90-like ATPase